MIFQSQCNKDEFKCMSENICLPKSARSFIIYKTVFNLLICTKLKYNTHVDVTESLTALGLKMNRIVTILLVGQELSSAVKMAVVYH